MHDRVLPLRRCFATLPWLLLRRPNWNISRQSGRNCGRKSTHQPAPIPVRLFSFCRSADKTRRRSNAGRVRCRNEGSGRWLNPGAAMSSRIHWPARRICAELTRPRRREKSATRKESCPVSTSLTFARRASFWFGRIIFLLKLLLCFWVFPRVHPCPPAAHSVRLPSGRQGGSCGRFYYSFREHPFYGTAKSVVARWHVQVRRKCARRGASEI